MMTEPIVLDVHAHLIPVDEAGLANIADVSWSDASRVMTIDGHKVGIKTIYDPAALLKWMDSNQVEHAYVSAPPPAYRQQLQGEAASAWFRYLNDGLMRVCDAANGKLTALLHLPTEHPALAVDIVREAAARGHRFFAMPAGTGDNRTLGDPAFTPLWEALDNARSFVFFHPGECADGRLKSFYLTNLLGNPYESAVALAHLMFEGILDRYPGMTTCFAHGGGLLPMVAGRFQRGADTARPGLENAASPIAAHPNVYVDCICHSEAAAIHAEATFGADKVVFGSDWPFPMGIIEPAEQLAIFAPERRLAYVTTNPNLLKRKLSEE